MNVLDLIDGKASSFSKNDRRIYEAIKKHPDSFATSSISDLAINGNFTKPALTRFAQKLGFSGFLEFQYQFSVDFENIHNNPKESEAERLATLLKQTDDALNNYPLTKLAKRILNARAIFLSGSSIMYSICETFEISLRINTTLPTRPCKPDDLPLHFKGDEVVLIYSSISGKNYQDFFRVLKNNNEPKPYIVLVTPNAKHPLRHNFDEVIVLPTARISSTSSAYADLHELLYFNERLSQALSDELHRN